MATALARQWQCSACGAARPADQYSKAQRGKKSLRKCRECVAARLRRGGADQNMLHISALGVASFGSLVLDADAELASQQISAHAAAGSDLHPPMHGQYTHMQMGSMQQNVMQMGMMGEGKGKGKGKGKCKGKDKGKANYSMQAQEMQMQM
jgi:hypothetical protein